MHTYTSQRTQSSTYIHTQIHSPNMSSVRRHAQPNLHTYIHALNYTSQHAQPNIHTYIHKSTHLSGSVQYLGQTEWIENDRSPKFRTNINMEFVFEEKQVIHLWMVDVDNPKKVYIYIYICMYVCECLCMYVCVCMYVGM